MNFEMIKTEIDEKVGIIYFNRPKALNAFNSQLMDEVTIALQNFDNDKNIHVIIVTGNEKAFAAGADLKELVNYEFVDAYQNGLISNNWEQAKRTRKPLIAAVSGYALGGGCEFAMMCDMIIASQSAKFGQPEITIGTIPGAGGTQRLSRFIGKAKAMDLCLTGRMMDVEEAERCGLVARIIPDTEDLLEKTKEIAKKIASFSSPISKMVKESVNQSFETGLEEGLLFERRLFHSTFALEDQKEGMKAFAEKRKAKFQNK